jgi:hypothetical protein
MKLQGLWPVERHGLFVLGILGAGLRYGKRLIDLQTTKKSPTRLAHRLRPALAEKTQIAIARVSSGPRKPMLLSR